MFGYIINGFVSPDNNVVACVILDVMYEEKSSEQEERVWNSGGVQCDTASSHDYGEEVRVDGEIGVGATSSRDYASLKLFRNISKT